MQATIEDRLRGIPLVLCTIALSLVAFLIILDYSIVTVAIPYIAGDLAVSKAQGTYLITSFAVGTAIVLPLTGWLTKRIGIIRLSIFALTGFGIFSWVCGMATELSFLVIARFIQGLFAGSLTPLSQTLIIRIFPPEKKNQAISFWSTIIVIANIVGPVLGGWITYDFSWPWIFFINIPICLFCIFIIQFFLPYYETEKEKIRADWVGLLFLTIGVTTLQFLLDKGEQYDWWNSTIIRTCIITSALSFLYLIIWEFFHKRPIIDLRLLKYRSYALSILLIGTQYALYFGSVVIVPIWLEQFMGYTSVWAGLAVAPLLFMPLLFSWTMNWLIGRFGAQLLLTISNLFFAFACFYASHGNTDVTFFWVGSGRFFFSFGLLFMFAPIFSLAVSEIPHEKLPQAAGMFHFVRAMAGGIGTSVFTTLWIRRSAFHHANVAANVVPERPEVSSFFQNLTELNVRGKEAWVTVNEFVNNQSAILGMNDCFYLMGWIFIVLFAILVVNYRRKTAR